MSLVLASSHFHIVSMTSLHHTLRRINSRWCIIDVVVVVVVTIVVDTALDGDNRRWCSTVPPYHGATRDPPEKSIPVCTLKNFPNQIQHTLQWARDWFEGEFKQCAEDVNVYLSATDSIQYLESLQPNTKLETLKTVHRILKDERPTSFEDCITWARLTFKKLFQNQIRKMLYNFPEDQVTSSGAKFWSGIKRCPVALQF